MLTQHYGSLSQDADASANGSDDDDAATTDQEDSKPAASEQTLPIEGDGIGVGKRCAELSTELDAKDQGEYPCLDLDADSLRKKHGTPLKRGRVSLESSRSSISSNEATGGMQPVFAAEQGKKLKPRSLFDKAINHTAKKKSSKLKKGRKRQSSSSSSSSHAMTLTQLFPMKNLESTESITGKRLQKCESAGSMVEVKIRGEIRPVTMKPGDCWKTDDKKLTGAGICLIQIGEIHIVNNRHVAEVRNAWMRIENTFVRDEGAEVKVRWVRVDSHHHKLPENVRPYWFTERVRSADIPVAPLCYSEEASLMASSYFYEYTCPPRSEQGKLCALDLFAGAGGTSFGLSKAGIDVKYKVEWNKGSSDTLNMNNSDDSTVFVEDIAKFIESCKTRRAAVYPQRGSIQYIHGR